ncbi:EXOS7 protein, partial [Polypterus senegalus]
MRFRGKVRGFTPSDDLRLDGRSCEDYRYVEVETDVVSNTSGSARVKLGHTDILVGIKAEIGRPKLDRPDKGCLEFFVDCSANATPEFEGRGGEELGTEIANALYRVYDNERSVDLKSLCITPMEHCWILYIDVLLLQCDGNLFDAISLAIKAALFSTKIPKVQMMEDEEGTTEIELSDDPFDCVRLNTENVPCIVTLCKIGQRHVVDATLQEKACSVASLLVSVTSKGTITCVRKIGGGSLDPESIYEMIEVRPPPLNWTQILASTDHATGLAYLGSCGGTAGIAATSQGHWSWLWSSLDSACPLWHLWQSGTSLKSDEPTRLGAAPPSAIIPSEWWCRFVPLVAADLHTWRGRLFQDSQLQEAVSFGI